MDINLTDHLNSLEKFVDSKFAYLFISFVMYLDLDIYINNSQINLFGLSVKWFQDKIDNFGSILVFISVFIIIYHFIFPFVFKLIIMGIQQLLRVNKRFRDCLFPEAKDPKYIRFESLMNYATFTNNIALYEYANKKEKLIDNWFEERDIYFFFCIIGAIYLIFSYTTLSTTTLSTTIANLFGRNTLLSFLIYCLLFLFIVFKFFTKILKVPSHNIYLSNPERVKKVEHFLLGNDIAGIVSSTMSQDDPQPLPSKKNDYVGFLNIMKGFFICDYQKQLKELLEIKSTLGNSSIQPELITTIDNIVSELSQLIDKINSEKFILISFLNCSEDEDSINSALIYKSTELQMKMTNVKKAVREPNFPTTLNNLRGLIQQYLVDVNKSIDS